MILESFGIVDVANKINELNKKKENLASSGDPENNQLIGEIVGQMIGYIIYLGLWVFVIYYAFCHNDIGWGIAIILFGLPMSIFYGIYLLAVKGDPRRRNRCMKKSKFLKF